MSDASTKDVLTIHLTHAEATFVHHAIDRAWRYEDFGPETPKVAYHALQKLLAALPEAVNNTDDKSRVYSSRHGWS